VRDKPTIVWMTSWDCEACVHLAERHTLDYDSPCLACETAFLEEFARPYWSPIVPIKIGETWPIYVGSRDGRITERKL
jgi:hypothetical protein